VEDLQVIVGDPVPAVEGEAAGHLAVAVVGQDVDKRKGAN
jgi:hypothetical protein